MTRIVTGALLLLICASGASAQPLTMVHDDRSAFSGARAIVAVDLDGDGWRDLVTANTVRNTVTVLRNSGGAFTVVRDTPVGAGPFDIAADDLDLDGVVDLVVTTPDARAIDVLYSRADGTLRSRVRLNDAGASRGLTLTDVTRDGRLDLVYTDFDRGVVVVRPGTAAGLAAAVAVVPVGARPQGVAAGDFNHDGFVDLAVANSGSSRLTVLYGRAGAAFARIDQARAPSVSGLNVVAATDLDNDGWTDIAAASTANDRLVVYRGSAAGFTLSSLPTSASPRGVAVADVNRDGRPDLIVAHRGSSTVGIWLGVAGAGVRFDAWGGLPAGSGSRAVAAADFDNDGRVDLATANEYAASVTQYTNGTAFPRGAFAFAPQSLGLMNATPSAIADFNHNGRWDLVTETVVLLDSSTRVNLPPMTTSGRAVAVADLDRDGHDDVVMTGALEWGSTRGRVDVLFGDGAGRFAREASYQFDWPGGLEIADMNRDGTPEILAFGHDGEAGEGVISILTPTADGGLGVRATRVEGWIRSADVVDADRNGTLDVVVSTEAPQLVVLRGDGAGGLGRMVRIPQGTPSYGVALADVNLDGRLDIVSHDGPSVGVRPAIGALAWDERISYPIITRRTDSNHPPGPFSVLVADLTHDGIPDVLTPAMAVMPGQRNGGLSPSEEFTASGGTLVVDWNHDGLLDVIASLDTGELAVLLNVAERPNAAPVARITTEIENGSVRYVDQFGFDTFPPPGVPPALHSDTSSDADLHALDVEWQDANGRTLAYGPYGLEFGRASPLPSGRHELTLVVRDGRGGEGRASYVVTITPFKEIVLWAGDWGDQISSRWQVTADDTAAYGRRLSYPNRYAPKVVVPSAAPEEYIDFFFVADLTQTYKLWIRGKAWRDDPYNDSLWLQFGGAATVEGDPAYRIGTTSALAVNLEECASCGLSGWGWEDDGWGAVNRNGMRLRFPEGGLQQMRIQIREDGFAIDQIVLSADKYLTVRPGAAKNDATVLERTLDYTAWD